MATACGRLRPARCKSSRALSKEAESLWPGWMMGESFFMSSPKRRDSSRLSRARIQLMLPLSVLISPLWAT
jgi:hypothetical protein